MGIGWPQKPEEGELSAADAARFIPRQDYLQGEYGFRCACLRCRVEEAIPDSGEEDELDDAEGHEGAAAAAAGDEDDAEELQEEDMELQLFLMKHLCESCGGTLAPIDGYDPAGGEPRRAMHECNSCGARRPDALFEAIVQAELAAAGVDDGGSDEESDEGQGEAGGDAAPQSSGDEDAAEHGAVDVD